MDTKNIFRLLSTTLLIACFILLYFLYNTNKKYNELERTTSLTIDSLRDELFIEKSDNGRHEITRDEIFNKYPQVGKEYNQFYEHETE